MVKKILLHIFIVCEACAGGRNNFFLYMETCFNSNMLQLNVINVWSGAIFIACVTAVFFSERP